MLIEQVFSVIAESTRREILDALAQEPKAVGQLVDELSVSQPTVSKHLRVLREAGVVTMRAQGQKRFYSINTEPLVLVSEWLDGLGAGLATAVAAPVRPAAPAQESRPAAAAATPRIAAPSAAVPSAEAPAAVAPAGTAGVPSRPVHPGGAAVVVRQTPAPLGETENSVPGQITRSVGRAANKAADLLANLPTFRRKRY